MKETYFLILTVSLLPLPTRHRGWVITLELTITLPSKTSSLGRLNQGSLMHQLDRIENANSIVLPLLI